jgi:hypothetical protein
MLGSAGKRVAFAFLALALRARFSSPGFLNRVAFPALGVLGVLWHVCSLCKLQLRPKSIGRKLNLFTENQVHCGGNQQFPVGRYPLLDR